MTLAPDLEHFGNGPSPMLAQAFDKTGLSKRYPI